MTINVIIIIFMLHMFGIIVSKIDFWAHYHILYSAKKFSRKIPRLIVIWFSKRLYMIFHTRRPQSNFWRSRFYASWVGKGSGSTHIRQKCFHRHPQCTLKAWSIVFISRNSLFPSTWHLYLVPVAITVNLFTRQSERVVGTFVLTGRDNTVVGLCNQGIG